MESSDPARVSLSRVAVGKTPGEPAGSPVKVGFENGHLVRRRQAVRREGFVHGGSEVHIRKRAARFLERLFPTATRELDSPPVPSVTAASHTTLGASPARGGPQPLAGSQSVLKLP
jgi:hypothetical protein